MRLTHLWYGLLGLPVLAVLAFVTLRPVVVLPRIAPAPGYSLFDQEGRRLTNEDMRGRIVLYNFTYTHCDDGACIQMNQILRTLQAQLGQVETGGIPVDLITISFDPDRDTVERLQVAANQVGADGHRWRLVSGDAIRLKSIIGGGFSIFYRPNDDDSYTFDPAFMLVDGAGILRAEYRTAAPELEIVMRDIRMVAQEMENSAGAARYAYEAAHLFVCYPR